MHHPVGVGIRERLGEVGDDAPYLRGRERADILQPSTQCAALDKRHDEVETAGCFTAAEEGYDVGMNQARGEADLLGEPVRAERT